MVGVVHGPRALRRCATYRALSGVSGGYQQSIPIADVLIATVAARNDVTLVHYAEDLQRIATVTRLPHRWVVPRGTA